jgi:hypothetical protein
MDEATQALGRHAINTEPPPICFSLQAAAISFFLSSQSRQAFRCPASQASPTTAPPKLAAAALRAGHRELLPRLAERRRLEPSLPSPDPVSTTASLSTTVSSSSTETAPMPS